MRPILILAILLAILPPLLWIGWMKYEAWRAERERQKVLADQRLLDEWIRTNIR